jgi:hypothetical protein
MVKKFVFEHVLNSWNSELPEKKNVGQKIVSLKNEKKYYHNISQMKKIICKSFK